MMTMKDFRELVKVKDDAAYEYLGFMEGLLEAVRNGLHPDNMMWHSLDEKRMALECAIRDLDNCFTTEAMRQSFKD